MEDLKVGEVQLWIRNETGFWLVIKDLHEYDLDKSMARAEIVEEIKSSINAKRKDGAK